MAGKNGESSPAGAACWSRRRHARRVYEIARTFEKVFGKDSLATEGNPHGRVRVVSRAIVAGIWVSFFQE